MMRNLRWIAALLVGALLCWPALAQDDNTVLDVAAATDDGELVFSTLVAAVEAAELEEALAEPKLTVFAPTDDAFDGLLKALDMDAEDLLADTDLLVEVLGYHVVLEELTAEDLLEMESVETLQGNEIALSTDDDGNLLLNGAVMVLAADIEADNGIIHAIDEVLLPDAMGMGDGTAAGGECIVSTDVEGDVRVRVGPGLNRTSVSFLPANTDFVVQGRSEDDDGTVWFQLDKEEAAPGRAINEAWVAADGLMTTGACDNVADASAPPIIPIAPSAPQNPPADDGGDGGEQPPADDGNTAAAPAGAPGTGTYTIFLAQTSNASCQGTGNAVIPNNELYNETVFPLSVVNRGNTLVVGGSPLTLVNGIYEGAITLDGLTLTTRIFPNTRSQFSGTFIFSFSSGGVGCSATTPFSATR